MRGNSAIGAIVAAVLGVAFVGVAAAQPSPDDKKKAQEHYKNAEAAMAAAAYEYAASEYGIAYELMKDPVLFFKIATADEKAGKCPIAVTYYRRYLKEGNPNAEFKKTTEEHIAACSAGGGGGSGSGSGSGTGKGSGSGSGAGSGSGSGTGSGSGKGSGSGAGKGSGSAVKTSGGAVGSADETMPPDLGDGAGAGSGAGAGTGSGAGTASDDTTAILSGGEPKPSGRRTGAWIAVAAGLAAGTVGTVLLLSAQSTEKDIDDLYASSGGMKPPAFDGAAKTRYDELVADGNRFNTLAYISFGVAGAAAVTAVVLFATDHGKSADEHALRVVPTASPTGVGFAAGFRF